MRKPKYLVLLCAVALGTAGCASKHIVRASSPSVSMPPPDVTEHMPVPETPEPEPPKATEEPPPDPTPPVPPMIPAKRPVPPRPRVPTPDAPAAKQPAPRISPELSAKDLEAVKRNTTGNISQAEQNMQQTAGKNFNAAQKDLTEKINAFLVQSHEAILADDWVRAQNLAEKARVLSTELVKSF
jgi:outer membrane biosynthesis protein TonB